MNILVFGVVVVSLVIIAVFGVKLIKCAVAARKYNRQVRYAIEVVRKNRAEKNVYFDVNL